MEELGVASSNDHDIRTVPMPDVDEMRAMIRTAAARASQPIREAIDKGLDKYELFAWWGAHAGATRGHDPTSNKRTAKTRNGTEDEPGGRSLSSRMRQRGDEFRLRPPRCRAC